MNLNKSFQIWKKKKMHFIFEWYLEFLLTIINFWLGFPSCLLLLLHLLWHRETFVLFSGNSDNYIATISVERERERKCVCFCWNDCIINVFVRIFNKSLMSSALYVQRSMKVRTMSTNNKRTLKIDNLPLK